MVLFEGLDGAGKTAAAAALRSALEPAYRVRVERPTPAGGAPWLARFVRLLPASGETVIWDRSWYHRATVERVMGFTRAADVEAFFQEVPHFEDALATHRIALMKFWLHVDPRTRARRLAERPPQALTDIDRHTMAFPTLHQRAAEEMLARTDSPRAPWLRLDASTPAVHAIIADLTLTTLRCSRGGPHDA